METTPSFVELVQRTDEDRRSFETHPRVLEIIADGLPLQQYRNLLLDLYHVVWHFNPICGAAASRIQDDNRQVRLFLYDHMKEEAGHEEWVLNDLVSLGLGKQVVIDSKPSLQSLGLLSYNYFAADRLHPCSVLGMIYSLEVIASVYGSPMTTAMKQSLLLQGEGGVSFISSHATMDAEHMIELRKVINRISDPNALNAIIESTRFNFHQFTDIVRAI